VKKRFLYHLFAIVGIILVIGLIASCGDGTEQQYKIIESREYTAANDEEDREKRNAYYYEKYAGKTNLGSAKADEIWKQYQRDINRVISDEMGRKNPAYGLLMVVKVDNYKLIGRCRWTDKPNWNMSYWVFDY
jgi:hypothetical protein